MLATALAEGYQAVVRAHGPPEFGGWRWSAVHRIDIWHLLRLPALSRLGIDVTAAPPRSARRASPSGSDASSWRMVVELGAQLRAWGTYPGRQRPTPASRRYDDRIDGWKNGELDELRFPRAPDGGAGELTAPVERGTMSRVIHVVVLGALVAAATAEPKRLPPQPCTPPKAW